MDDVVELLKADVDEYVRGVFEGYRPLRVRGHKAIHEAIWGTSIFAPHEIAVLDTPLLQRLRQISQTGLAFLTYPSANHSRFDHTLGVTAIATRFVEHIDERRVPSDRISQQPETNAVAEIRMAAILHDCGHGFLSHVSEELYRSHPAMVAMLADDFAHCKPHEVLSYLIVLSPTFRSFWDNNVLSVYDMNMNLERIASYIIGKPGNSDDFCCRIINGAFDADKLDYIRRDATFAGLGLTVDLDRFFYTLSVGRVDGIETLVAESPVPLEQILFSKMLLYSTIYHHQKVKASDSMVQSIVEYVQDKGIQLKGSALISPVDFLRLTDHDLLSDASTVSDTNLRSMIRQLNHRYLFRRAVAICRDTVDNYDDGGLGELLRLTEAPSRLKEIRKDIAERARDGCSVYDVSISLPEQPSLREATQAFVGGPMGQPVALNELFPVEGWLRAYSDRKWRGHVFCRAGSEDQVAQAAVDVLSELGVQLNRERSRTYCHLL